MIMSPILDFMKLMACADVQHMEPAHKCMDAFVAHLEHIGTGAQNRQIELTCCAFQFFQECIFTGKFLPYQCSKLISSVKIKL